MSDEQIDVSGGVSVLLLGESGPQTGRCCDALLDVGAAEDRAELTVTFSDDVTDREGFDNGTTGRQPAKRGHVTVGDVLRSADESAPNFGDPVASEVVEDPTDLKAIGTSVSRFCEVWSDGGHRMVLCFDSLTDLLEHAEPKVVFQFLHTLLERLASVETVAHFHVDPDQLDEQTLSTFGSLFEEVLEPAEYDRLLGDETDAEAASETDPGSDSRDSEDDDSDDSPSLDRGIPATSGSSQASDDDIASQLDDQGERYEVADGGTTGSRVSTQASDDDVAERIPEVGDEE